MTKELEKLYQLVYSNLTIESPILSGNMLNGIKIISVSDNKIEIEIEAKYYDLERYKREGVIVYTNERRGAKTNYAQDVNEHGGFFSENESKHWVNRALYDAVMTIANEINANVINRLGL